MCNLFTNTLKTQRWTFNNILSIRCTYIIKSKGFWPVLLEFLPFVKFLNAVKKGCVHIISLTNGWKLTKLITTGKRMDKSLVTVTSFSF